MSNISAEYVEQLIKDIPGRKHSAKEVWELQEKIINTLRTLVKERDEAKVEEGGPTVYHYMDAKTMSDYGPWVRHADYVALQNSLAAAEQSGNQTTRCKVPDGQTPLDDNLGHRLLDVFNEGMSARETGKVSPYHGHSLEHCIHAAGWVQKDLKLALDAVKAEGNA